MHIAKSGQNEGHDGLLTAHKLSLFQMKFVIIVHVAVDIAYRNECLCLTDVETDNDVVVLKDESFDTFVNEKSVDAPVLVEFYAPW